MSPILSSDFVNSYKAKTAPFGFNGLGFVVYKRTYSRLKDDGTNEDWYETVARCVNGAQKIGAGYTQEEAERLYDHVFNLRCNFAGRMLWQLGTPTVDKLCANSLLNCWFATINEPKAFLFLFENLMLGGGVGFSVRREDVHELPRIKKGVTITHQDTKDADYIVPDSRQGWIRLLSNVLDAFYVTGKSFTYSTILVRGAGEKISGFGGTASGPKILIEGIEKIVSIFKGREEKKLRSIDALDICNIIGSIVVAGNVRRCLPGESLVHLRRGLVPIRDVVVGDEALTSLGYRLVTARFEQGVQSTVVIRTQDGVFECTPNHRMAVLTGVDEYRWVVASELKAGDRLVSPRQSIEGVETKLPAWSYERVAHSTTCQGIVIPELDADMAWFVGLFHADGYTYANRKQNGFNAYVSLVFGENELALAEKAKAQLERFGLTNVTLKPRKDERSLMVHCMSKQFAWYADEHLKQPNTAIQVPNWIQRGTHDVRMAYVCGVMDGDGASQNRPVQVVSTVYEGFARQIQALLYSCGIESRLGQQGEDWSSRIGWQKQWFVSLISTYAKTQVNECGFLLKNVAIGSKASFSNGYPSDWITSHRRVLGAHANEQVTTDSYAKHVAEKPISLVPVAVVGLEQGRQVETFDIEVAEEHEFYCNGYLTHNSAEIALGDPDDYLYLRAKNWSLGNVPNHRAMSNNTIYADSFAHISDEIWNNGYTIDPQTGHAKGEPYGFFNLPLSQRFGRIKDGPMKGSDIYPEDRDNCSGTNPCGEVSLSSYECCNLSELYLNNITSPEQLIDCAKLLYKTQKAIAAMPFLHEETNAIVHKNMRLGLGVTGVCQSLDKVDWLDQCYEALRALDVEWSKQRGWPQSIKLTTIKPSGTLSLLGGATPGVHPAYSQFYIRRVRMSSADKLAAQCREAGYVVEYAKNFDGTENRDTLVVEFPCRTPDGAILAKDMPVLKQLDMVAKLQHIWSDNAVSVTAYYEPSELGALKAWLKENYEKKVKSVSFLLRDKHGFLQAPYQEITEAEYVAMSARIRPLSNVGSGVLESLECASGACPIR